MHSIHYLITQIKPSVKGYCGSYTYIPERMICMMCVASPLATELRYMSAVLIKGNPYSTQTGGMTCGEVLLFQLSFVLERATRVSLTIKCKYPA